MEQEVPNLKGSPPAWYVTKGHKVDVREDADSHQIRFGSGRSHLSLTRVPGGTYSIHWGIEHGNGKVVGEVVRLSLMEVRLMFALANRPEDVDLPSFSGVVKFDAFKQGAYARDACFLNVPHPGTGLHGDPNISIKITDELRKAVAFFLVREISEE